MWLKSIKDPHNILFESTLKFSSEVAAISNEQERTRRPKGIVLAQSMLPIISIGVPDSWKLEDIYPRHKMPKPFITKLEEHDFHLVRLACSLRPQHKEIAIEHARFTLFFQPAKGSLPVVYDMHPIRIDQEIKHNAKYTLNPTLKFSKLEVGIGEASFGFEYQELIPIISGTGIGESAPAWDFQEARGHPLEGSKIMHLLLKSSKDAKPIFASAHFSAKVRAYNTLYNAIIGLDEDDAHIRLPITVVE